MDISRLRRDQRLTLARLDGAAQRLAGGRYEWDEPAGDPIGALRQISTDPYLLGLTAGRLSMYEWQAAAVELLRAAGADMQVATDHAVDVRARRYGRIPFTPP